MSKEKSKNIFKALALLGLFLFAFGLTYALFQITLNGTKKVKISTGNISLRLLDENDNYIDNLNPNADAGYSIELSNEVPMDYETASQRTDNVFVFKLKNEGTIKTKYSISLEDLELDTGEERLNDEFIGFEVLRDNNEYVETTTNLASTTNRVITIGVIDPDEEYEFALRLWLDDDTVTQDNQEDAMNKVFAAHLKVDGVQTEYDEIDLNFKNFNVTSSGNPTYVEPTIDNGTTKIELKNMNITLSHPGDKVVYTVDIVNDGTKKVAFRNTTNARNLFGFYACYNEEYTDECKVWDINNYPNEGDGEITILDLVQANGAFRGFRNNDVILAINTEHELNPGEKKTITIYGEYLEDAIDFDRNFPVINGIFTVEYYESNTE